MSRFRRAVSLSSAAAGLALLVSTSGCGTELDSAMEVKSLRVLAVKKSAPYVAPGEDVELSMLWYDGRRDEDGELVGGPVHRVWLGGCVNPLGDFYYGCTPDLLFTLAALRAAEHGLSAEDLAEVAAGLQEVDSEAGLVAALRDLPFDLEGPLPVETPEAPLAIGQFAVGDRFTLPVPEDVITRFPSSRPPYGLLVPFFAACAGTLEVDLDVLNQVAPLVCRGESGQLLGADDFVLGYSTVYAYESLRNENPIIRGFAVDDFEISLADDSPFLCIDDDCLTPDDPLAEGEACARHLECASEHCSEGVCGAPLEVRCNENVPCIDPCDGGEGSYVDGARQDDPDCEKVHVKPLLDEADVEDDILKGTEQMWLNYHSDRGGLVKTVRLLNDATKGWNPDYGSDLFGPQGTDTQQKMYVWAIVRDSRGGASWARQTIFVNPTD